MWILYAFSVLAGISNTIMAGCNSTLGKKLHHPIAASIVVYVVGLISVLIVFAIGSLFKRTQMPDVSLIREVPWWGWIGGALGSVYIIANITVPNKIGASGFTGMTVTAAIITSIVMDHFGLVGFKQHSAGIARLIGALLMFSGLFLVVKY